MQEERASTLLHDITVVIPAYNAEQFIVDALESIALQSCKPKEVIVVNDGSSDRTGQIVKEWISRVSLDYPVYIFSQVNRGISSTRNVGIQHATGKWIAFLDSDDIWEPSHLELLIDATLLVPSAIAAYGAGRLLVNGELQDLLYDEFWDNPSRTFGRPIDNSRYFIIDTKIFPRLIKGNFIKPSSLMVSRALANKVGLFNECLGTAEDREFLVRLICNGQFVYVPLAITKYRWHEDNASQTKNIKRNVENGLRALKLILENTALCLSSKEIVECRKEIGVATHGYLYICSQEGCVGYINGLGFIYRLFGLSNALFSLSLRHIVRCLIPSRLLG